MSSNVTLCTVASMIWFYAISQRVVARLSGATTPSKIRPEGEFSLLLRKVGLIFLPFAVIFKGRVPLGFYVVGVIVMTLGLGLGLWAQSSIGCNWVGGVGHHKNHQLICTGLYKHVRHPIYTCIAITFLGATISTLNPFIAIVLGLRWVRLASRIPEEEKLMARLFKRKWAAYRDSTGYFFPLLIGRPPHRA